MKHFTNIFHHIMVTRLSALLVILAVTSPTIVRAQVYPIQVVTEITPPYSVYLSDYTTMGTGKLAVNILLTDISRFNYPVKLRLVIEGEGGTISTSPSYMPEQIMLDGGSPLRLSGDELAGYFNPKNLDFKGYSKEKFMQTGALPEGIYRIGFQALDYNKSIAVSLTGSATAWLVLNDPPMFNTPEKNAKLTASEPQNIMFQWMPRHLGSPNSAFNAEYIFQLYEIWPDGRNPNEVVASTQPLIEKTSTSTSFLYSNSTETPLIPGRQYAYRAQAHDVEGRDLFRNKGYSEVQMFTYGDPCDVPTQIEAQSTNSGKITINWQPATYNTAYYVQYREAGSTNGVWYPKTTYVNSLTIGNLNAKTKYEYQVQGQCGAVNSDFSEILTITTQAKKETKVICGLQDSASIITNKLPLTSLLPGDIITCGKFETQVTKATGGNGKWTGEGFMHVPFMGVKVHVTFTNVAINERFQVTKGRVESVYNPNSNYIVDLNSKSTNTSQQNSSTTTSTVNDTIIVDAIDTIFKTPEGNMLVISQAGDTTTIHRNADGSGMIINSAGDSTAIPANQPVVVSDSNGNTTAIDKDGNISIGNDVKNSASIARRASDDPIPYIAMKTGRDTLFYHSGEVIYLLKQNKSYKFFNVKKHPFLVSGNLVIAELQLDTIQWNFNGIVTNNKPVDINTFALNAGQTYQLKAKIPPQYATFTIVSSTYTPKIDSTYNLEYSIVIVDNPLIEFIRSKSYNGGYGFDNDFWSCNTITCYDTAKINGIDYKIPWLSLQQDKAENIQALIKIPPNQYKALKKLGHEFKFYGTNLTINGTDTFRININTLKEDENLIDLTVIASQGTTGIFTTPGKIYATSGNKITGKLNYFSLDKSNFHNPELNIVPVFINPANTGTNIDTGKVQTYFNEKSFNQAYVSWTVKGQKPILISWNSDSLILKDMISEAYSYNWYIKIETNYLRIINDIKAGTFNQYNSSAIQQFLCQYFSKKNPILYKYAYTYRGKYLMFITDFAQNGGEDGIGMVNGHICTIFKNGTGSYDTYVHEMGHNLGLSHVFENTGQPGERGTPQGRSGHFMDYFNSKLIFWETDWKFIYNQTKP